jgi:hypothetical protein
LPCGVRGPVVFCALRRLAAILAALVPHFTVRPRSGRAAGA